MYVLDERRWHWDKPKKGRYVGPDGPFLFLKCLVLLHRKRILTHPRPVSDPGTRSRSTLGSGNEKTGKWEGKCPWWIMHGANFPKVLWIIWGTNSQFAPISWYFFPPQNLEASKTRVDSGCGIIGGLEDPTTCSSCLRPSTDTHPRCVNPEGVELSYLLIYGHILPRQVR